jgi:hypothetical protein
MKSKFFKLLFITSICYFFCIGEKIMSQIEPESIASVETVIDYKLIGDIKIIITGCKIKDNGILTINMSIKNMGTKKRTFSLRTEPSIILTGNIYKSRYVSLGNKSTGSVTGFLRSLGGFLSIKIPPDSSVTSTIKFELPAHMRDIVQVNVLEMEIAFGALSQIETVKFESIWLEGKKPTF